MPDPVYRCPCEIGIVLLQKPVCKNLTRILLRRIDRERFPVKGTCLDTDRIEIGINDLLFPFIRAFVTDAREEFGKTLLFLLRQVLQPDTCEGQRDCFCQSQWRTVGGCTEKICVRDTEIASGSGQHIPRHVPIRTIRKQFGADLAVPCLNRIRPEIDRELGLDPQHIRKTHRQQIGIFGRGEQTVDQLCPFILRLVGKKPACFRNGGKPSRHGQVNPSQEYRIRGCFRRGDIFFFPAAAENCIDLQIRVRRNTTLIRRRSQQDHDQKESRQTTDHTHNNLLCLLLQE